jgi:threonine/homoserine/homoserine lactone efflux protein
VSELLPPLPLLGAFLVASLVLAVTPGPGVLYIVARSASQGRAAGLASVAGVALGNLGNAIGASLGLAALFAVSALAFSVVKYLGAAYLIVLGVQALRSARRAEPAPAVGPGRERSGRIFCDGFVVALLNPKTTLFFAAFLPQFLHAPASPALQSIALGALFVAIAAVTDSAYALAAGSVRPWLQQAKGAARIGRYATGGAFIGLGLLTALSGQRARS